MSNTFSAFVTWMCPTRRAHRKATLFSASRYASFARFNSHASTPADSICSMAWRKTGAVFTIKALLNAILAASNFASSPQSQFPLHTRCAASRMDLDSGVCSSPAAWHSGNTARRDGTSRCDKSWFTFATQWFRQMAPTWFACATNLLSRSCKPAWAHKALASRPVRSAVHKTSIMDEVLTSSSMTPFATTSPSFARARFSMRMARCLAKLPWCSRTRRVAPRKSSSGMPAASASASKASRSSILRPSAAALTFPNNCLNAAARYIGRRFPGGDSLLARAPTGAACPGGGPPLCPTAG
mmetsp:Transcript_45165/g.130409  ORF Transcript_45165/g.130409 Transcript_45165/m.130409 type:complete len:298 (-) Transcript_45165:17-910(-)